MSNNIIKTIDVTIWGSLYDFRSIPEAYSEILLHSSPTSDSTPVSFNQLDQHLPSRLSFVSTENYYSNDGNDTYLDVPRLYPTCVQVKISDNNGTSITTTGAIFFNYPYSCAPIDYVRNIREIFCFHNIEPLLPRASPDDIYVVLGRISPNTRSEVVAVLASELNNLGYHIKVKLVNNC